MVDGPRYSEDRIRLNRVSRRTSAEDTGTGITVSEAHKPKEHTQQQERNDEKKRKSKANSRQDKSTANSRQKKKTCEKPKVEHEESI